LEETDDQSVRYSSPEYGSVTLISLDLVGRMSVVGLHFLPRVWYRARMKFSELVRLLERDGFRLIKEKGSIRYYAKAAIRA